MWGDCFYVWWARWCIFYIWIIWGTGGTHGKVPALPLPTHFCSFVCCPESFAPSVSDINKSGDIFVLLPEWPQSLRCCKFLKLEQRVWFRQRGASILHKAPQGMCYSYGNICERERSTHTRRVMDGRKEKEWMQEGDGARERETQRGTWRAPVAKGEEHGGAYCSRCLHAPPAPCTCLWYESSQAHTVAITFPVA